MSSLQYMRAFISERLTAAAEEIFGVFEKTIVEYEEEAARQSKLLDIVWKPELRLRRAELPQRPVCKEEEFLAGQQLCNQERNSSLDHEEPGPLRIKEEEEDISASQEGERPVLKQETDAFTLTPDCEQGDHVEPEPGRDHQLLSHNSPVADSRDQRGSEHVASGSTANVESDQQRGLCEIRSHSSDVYNSPISNIASYTHTGEESFKCDVCGKVLKNELGLDKHVKKIHKGEKPYLCNTCGKGFVNVPELKRHTRTHTGEKTFTCDTCGRGFLLPANLKAHIKSHSSEKPYPCGICGKRFKRKFALKNHTNLHMGAKPYSCKICGRGFVLSYTLKIHIRTHTGEKPYACDTCGKKFSQSSDLKKHSRLHTGERPYTCDTCGKSFVQSSGLKTHMRSHTGEKPHSCNTCGKGFSQLADMRRHSRLHTNPKAHSQSTQECSALGVNRQPT